MTSSAVAAAAASIILSPVGLGQTGGRADGLAGLAC